MSGEKILCIDDEAQIRKLLEITLRSSGYKALEAADGAEGLAMAASHQPALILLDLGLPDESGLEVLRKLRSWYTKPVIILSVQDDEDTIIEALDRHASDYITKPFRTGELLARIRSHLRNNMPADNNTLLSFGKLEIDLLARSVKKGTEAIKLTATEYDLLALLAKNEGRVLTQAYILRQVWGAGHEEQSQTLRVFIAQLRKKIEDDFTKPQFIITESRVGYRFVSP